MADGSVIIEIDGDDSGFKKSLNDVKKEAGKSESAVEGIGKAGKEAGNDIKQGMKEASSGIDDANESVEDGKEKLEDLNEEATNSNKSLKKLASDLLSSFKKFDSSIGDITGKVGGLGGMLKTAFTVTAAVEAAKAISSAFQSAIEKATEMKKALNQLQASTGASAEEMKEYKSVIESLYSNNLGDSLDDVASAVSSVRKNLGELDASSMSNLTAGALALRDVFEYDVSESTRAAKAMMDSFGTSADEAFNLITAGAQNGLDYSGELLDSISEYSVQFAKVGLDANDMFQIFQKGAETGAWNLDKIGDAVKEFSIRAIDGSDSTAEGFNYLGLSASKMAEKFAAGGDTAKEAFEQTIKALAKMKDPVKQNIAGVDLFGTMWEDLGPEVMTRLAGITDEAYASADALQNITNIKYDDFGSAMEAARRSLDILIGNIGSDLEPQMTSVMGAVASGIQNITAGLEENGFNGAMEAARQTIQGFAGGISEGLPEMLSSGAKVILQFVSGAVSLTPQLLQIGAGLISGLIKGIAQTIPELPGMAADAIENFISGLESGDWKILSGGTKLVLSLVKGILKSIPEMAKASLRILEAFGRGILVHGAAALYSRGVDIIKWVVQGIEEYLPKIVKKAAELIANFKEGMLIQLNEIKTGTAEIGNVIISTLKSIISKAKEVGKNIIEGLWNGISSKMAWIKSKVQGAVDSVKSVFTGIKGFFTGSPSRWSAKVGGWVIQGLANGFSKNEKTAVSAADAVVQNVKTSVAKGMSTAVKSAAKLIGKITGAVKDAAEDSVKDYKAIGEAQADNLVKGLETKKDAALDAFNSLVDQQFKAYKDKSGNLTGAYKTAADQLTDAYKESLDEGYKEAKQLVEDRMSEIADEYQTQYDEIIKKQEDLQSKLAGDFGELFEFEDNSVKLENIDESIDEIKQYNDLLNKLRDEYGATDDFLAEITSLGADKGLQAAKKLVSMSQDEFGVYQEKWLEKQRLAKEVASAFYADQLQTIDEEFNQKMDEALADIPESLEDIGKNSIQGWIDGMNSKLPDLEAKARSIASRVISAMRSEMDIHSPSGKTEKLVGIPAAQGIGVGFEKEFPATMQKLKNTVDVEMTRTSARLGATASGGSSSTTREITNNTTTVDRIVRIEVTGSDGEFVRWLRSKLKAEDDRVGPSLA